jgi:hypothetical protein
MASQLQSYVIGTIIIGVLITCGVVFIASFRSVDPTYGTSDANFDQFNRTFNKLDRAMNATKGLENTITNSENDYGPLGAVGSLFATGWNALKGIFSSFSFIGEILIGVSSFFGIPTFITGAIISIISIVIVFAIFSAIFSKEL